MLPDILKYNKCYIFGKLKPLFWEIWFQQAGRFLRKGFNFMSSHFKRSNSENFARFLTFKFMHLKNLISWSMLISRFLDFIILSTKNSQDFKIDPKASIKNFPRIKSKAKIFFSIKCQLWNLSHFVNPKKFNKDLLHVIGKENQEQLPQNETKEP